MISIQRNKKKKRRKESQSLFYHSSKATSSMQAAVTQTGESQSRQKPHGKSHERKKQHYAGRDRAPVTSIARVDETSALTANKEKVGAALSALEIAPHFGHIRLEDPGVPVSDRSSDRRDGLLGFRR
ncbi:hypothetical protein BDV30DRAFT_7535 [Aspergillus minisclerotigenes]|uniref:Uncharacterized protein n=1 Tax=Aspergillus minisclerotigenes TaxID=656917 RepID=A0A5N6JEC4_9EURO|nr:hypothetical protein BDV30DRAFT_7535 [Aspergillus minisclerotigenes]